MKKYCNYCGCDVEFGGYGGVGNAELRGNSHAVLWDNSHAELRGNSHAVLWDNSHADCNSPYACGILKSSTASCEGRHLGDKSIPPKEYLKACGIPVKNQYAIMFKSVKPDFTSFKTDTVKYVLGKEVIAPDWDGTSVVECGKGLHLSPTVQQAMSFGRGRDGIYLACRVKLSDMASLPAFAEYPDKIRVRACIPLYQVNEKGEKAL